MKIRHPDFNQTNSLDELEAYLSGGVYSVIPEENREKLSRFLAAFEKYRGNTGARLTDVSVYPDLPFSVNDAPWKAKQQDVAIIDKICSGKQRMKILDFGAWNGWLSHYLSKKGHIITAADIFIDGFDGLGAKKHYPTDFTALQMLPEDLWRIEEKFDLIVFNRNWAYMADKEKVFNDALRLLEPDGQIVFTGLSFYRNPEKIRRHLQTAGAAFEKEYGMPILFTPSKGYLDFDDYTFFNNRRIALHYYNPLKSRLRKWLRRSPVHQYGIYTP